MDDKRMAVLLDKVGALGWSVCEDEDSWDIRQRSPAGEDFGFYIHKSAAKDADDFVRGVREFADDFDPDENIEMWVEARKNGVGGVPDIRTLVKDADDEQDMLDELADALEGVRYSFDIGGATDLVADFMYDRGFDIHRPAIIWDGDDSYTMEGDYHKNKEGGKA